MPFNLIEILYYIFIFPLQSVLGFALELLFGAIKSYGLSIIFLSLIINLILLKLSKIAEAKAHNINALKARCDSKIAEFKRVFKGAELQSYIRTLYKQRHYHPIFALGALGGLALQVPFFIAILFLLQDLEEIKGESFLWISDLSAPDSVGGVHLLPILMTIISLINVWIVAKDSGARIQGIIIALIFLVLLYNMPSALVLYWTTNMVFALCNSLLGMRFRNIFRHTERSEVSKSRESKINNESITQKRICESHKFTQSQYIANDSQVAKINSSLSTKANNDNNIKTQLASFFILRKPLKITVITLTAILAILLCATFSLMIYAKDNVQTAPLSFDWDNKARIGFEKWDFLLRSKSIAQVKLVDIAWDKAIDSSNIKIISNAKRFVYFESEKAFDLEKGTNLGTITYAMDFTPLLKHILFYYAVILGTLLDIYLLICCCYKYRDSIETNLQTYRKISHYTILCIAFLICVFTPYQLYNTDITQFDSTQTYSTLSALFGAFMLVSFVVIYAISFIPKRFSNFTAFVLSLVLFNGIVYSFVLVGDYGLIDRFIFQKTPFTNSESQSKSSIIFIIVFFCSMAFISLLYKRLIYIWQIVLLTLVIVTSATIFQIIGKQLDFIKIAQESQNDSKQSMPIVSLRGSEADEAIHKSNIDCHDLTSSSLAMTENSDCAQSHNDNARGDSNNTIKPPYENELFSYSKTQKNIVVLVLDMFSGSHTPYILEQFSHLKEQLDGFILFPNTITTANGTIQTIATLIGGEQYAIYNINKNLARSVDKAFIDIGSNFANNGFNVGLIAWTQNGTSNIENTIANNNVFTMDMHNTFLFTNFVNYYYDNGGVVFNNAVKTNSAFIEIELAQLVNFGLFKFLPEFFLDQKSIKMVSG